MENKKCSQAPTSHSYRTYWDIMKLKSQTRTKAMDSVDDGEFELVWDQGINT